MEKKVEERREECKRKQKGENRKTERKVIINKCWRE